MVAALVGLAVAIGGWVSGLLELAAGEYVQALRTGTSRALHPPCSVGEYIAVHLRGGEVCEGYLRDVATEAFTVVPLSSFEDPPEEPRRIRVLSVSELVGASFRPSRGPYCDGERCIYVNEPYCLRARVMRAEERRNPADDAGA